MLDDDATGGDAYITGEIWSWAQPWLGGDEFDAVMNYRFATTGQDFFVNQQNGKDLVIDDFTHQFCHSAQSGVEVKGGIYNVCHLKQKRFDLDLRLWLRQCHVEVLIISALGAALERGC